jgi:hypothetical protein
MISIFSNYVISSSIALILLCMKAKFVDMQRFEDIVEIGDRELGET